MYYGRLICLVKVGFVVGYGLESNMGFKTKHGLQNVGNVRCLYDVCDGGARDAFSDAVIVVRLGFTQLHQGKC